MRKYGQWLVWKRRSSVLAPPPSRIHMRALEPRVLLDAASTETVIDAVHNATHESFADSYIAENFSEHLEAAGRSAQDIPALDLSPALVLDDLETVEQGRIEVAFIAADIPNLETFLAELSEGTEVILLTGDGDGVAQIAETLALRSNIDAIHIISHGQQGSLSLGTADLTIDSMATTYRAQMAMIGDALTEAGDILVYGCEFAEGDIGRQAAETLSLLTNADVAASTDITGSATREGDWRLELATGTIETTSIDVGSAWDGTLAVLEENSPPFATIERDAKIGLTRPKGETFTHTTSGGGTYQLESIDLAIKQDAFAPNQIILVEIYDHTDDSFITSGTITNSTVTTSYAWHNIQFDTVVTLDSGHEYYFLATTDDASDTVNLGAMNSNTYPNGVYINSFFTLFPDRDMLFSLNGSTGNSDPIITSGSGGSDYFLLMEENQIQAYTLTATDSDLPADTLSYSIIGGSDQAFFGINPSTGELFFLNAPDFETELDSNLNNIYNVEVQVSDGNGGTDSQLVHVIVFDVNDLPIATGGAVTIDEDQSHSFQPLDFNFTDDEGDALQSITITNLNLAGGTLRTSSGTVNVTNGMTITSASGTLVYTPAPNSNANASFDYTVNDDDLGVISATMAITVNPVNDAPVITNNGSAGGVQIFTDENVTQLIDFNATDADLPGDTLTYSIIDGADAALFNIDPVTGILSFNVSPDFENPIDTNSNNIYWVEIQVSDGNGGTDSQYLRFDVENVDEAPVATGGSIIIFEDIPFVFAGIDFNFTDEENDAIQSITLTNLNLSGGTLTHTGGTINVTDGMTVTLAQLTDLTYLSALNSSANASFDYTVNDANIGTVSATMAITVTPVNDAPIITSFGGASNTSFDVNEGQTLAATIQASDVDLPGDTLSYSIVGGADAGDFSIDSVTGELSFNIVTDYENPVDGGANNSYRVIVRVSDGQGGTDQVSIRVDVVNVNEVPVATGGSITTNEDTPHTFSVAEFTFSDEENDALQSVTITNLSLSGGTLVHSGGTVVTNGMVVTLAELTSLTFAPALNSNVGASFDYTVNDNGAGTVSASMAITVAPVNDVPVATSGAVTTNEDTVYSFSIVDFGFTDIENDPLQSITFNNFALAGGTLTHFGGFVTPGMTLNLTELASLKFTPSLNSTAPASFFYSVNDADLGPVIGEMAITVAPTNDAPVITSFGGVSAVSYNLDEGILLAATIQASDVDVPADTLSYSIVGGVDAGQFSINAITGVLTFNTVPDFENPTDFGTNGSYNVNVQVFDGQGGTDQIDITINVIDVNEAPVATGGSVTTNEDTPHTFSASEFTFTDEENDALQSVTITNLSLAGGTLTHTGGTIAVTNGMTVTSAELADLTFIPALNSSIGASFDYSVNDAVNIGVVTATMAIAVTPANDLPVATGGVVTTNEDTPHSFVVTDFNFTDEESDALQSVTITNLSLAGGTLIHSGGTVVTDGVVLTAGEVASLIFTPAANSSANATFDYTVNDSGLGVVSAAMLINVTADNDAPVATGSTITTGEDTPHIFSVADFNFTDEENDALQSVTITNLSLAGGTLVHSGGAVVTDGMTVTLAELASLTFTPALNSNVGASFDYTVNDADTGTVAAAMTITVTFANDLPIATGGTVATAEDTPVTFVATDFGFTDIENDPLQSITINNLVLAGGTLIHSGGTSVTNGMTLTLAELASLTFTPAPNSSTNASFDYAVNDADAGTITASMAIIVTPVNDIPIATGGTVTTVEDTSFTFASSDFGFNDIEADALQSITISNLSLAGGTLVHSGGTVVTNGMSITLANIASLTFTPSLNSSANASFDYTVNDGDNGVIAAAMVINVTVANDSPVATGGAVITLEDASHVFSATEFNFNDVEGDLLQSITITDLDLAGGTLTHSGGAVIITDGMSLTLAELTDLTYTPAPNITLSASFDYAVNDANNGSTVAPMTISVTPINDAPIATGAGINAIENIPHVFSIAEFAYTDIENNVLQSITITNLSLAGGTLTHTAGTVPVTNGSVVTLAEIADLTFTPAPDQLGDASFDYAVNDADVGLLTETITITVAEPTNPVITDPAPTPTDPIPTVDPIDPLPDETPDDPETEDETPPPSTTTSTPAVSPPPVITAPAPSPVAQAPVVALPVVEPQVEPEPIPEPAVDSSQNNIPISDDEPNVLPGYTFQPVNQVEFKHALDRAGKDVRQYDEFLGTTAAKVSFTFGSLLSVGGVSFVLRGGALAAALMSAMPAWNRFDPISIVNPHRKDDEEHDDDITDIQMMKKFVEDARSRVNKGSIL